MVKGLILEYLKNNKSSAPEIVFHLITHEQKEFSLTHEKAKEKEQELSQFNIKWYPIKYLSGSFLVIKKAINFLQTFFITIGIKFKYKPVAIMGFLSISGGFSYLLSKLFGLKLIVYCYEPHSEYMIDFNIWKSSGLKYRLLKKFEILQIKKADHLVVPNNYTKALVQKYRSSTNIYVCPISINTDTMVYDEKARNTIRKKLNAEDKTILIYTGKFGGIYYSADEVIKFFAGLYTLNNSFFFYIITPTPEEVKRSVSLHNLSSSAVHVSVTVSYEELNQHISAADIGFVALPSYPSQIYRTPVKTAIYLSCGLPYIVNKNIGEDDIVAKNKNVGVVINNLDEDPASVIKKINDLLKDSQLHQRCRTEAENTRSIKAANVVLSKIFSEL